MQILGESLKSFCEKNSSETLDLSYLRIFDLGFLRELNVSSIKHLILDGNLLDDGIEFRYLPNVSTLSLNKNSVSKIIAQLIHFVKKIFSILFLISDLNHFLIKIRSSCPMLRHLSLIGNPACPHPLNMQQSTDDISYRNYR